MIPALFLAVSIIGCLVVGALLVRDLRRARTARDRALAAALLGVVALAAASASTTFAIVMAARA